MARQQRHIVNRQILELHTGSRQDAYEIQQQLRDAFYATVIPMMQEVFSSIVGPEEILRIDKLEISLGSIRRNKLEEDFPALIRKYLEDALARQKQLARINKPSPERKAAEKNLPVFSSARKPAFEAYIHFLKKGFLPWWANPQDYPSLKKLGQQLLVERQENLLNEIRIHVNDPVFTRRLIFHFPEESLGLIIKALNPVVYQLMQQVHAPLLVLHPEQALIRVSPAYFTQLLWQNALIYAVTQHNQPVPDIAGRNSASSQMSGGKHGNTATKSPENYLRWLLPALLSAVNKENTPGAIKNLTQRLYSYTITSKRQEVKPLRTMLSKLHRIPAAKDVKGKEKLNPDVPPVTEIFEGCVSNAGIVLVWPYLLHLFEGLGWMQDKAFMDPEAAGKAVLLLQFMVTGQEGFEEQELVLNKLLCGLEIQHPVDINQRLAAREKEEAENLLRFVAGQWTALKGISIAGLREGFLKKEGILKQEPKGWVLQVERRTIDLLLDKLPWAISIIRLPWNNYLLYVEW